MNKIIIALSLLFSVVFFNASAQTDRGDWLVGGQLAFNTTSGDNSFTLAPSAGYFFGKNFAVGSEITLSFSKLGDAKTSIVGFGPFVRYYFELKDPKFKPLIHASFDVLSVTDKTPIDKTTNTATSFFIGGGGAYFINDNVALEGVLGYNNTKVENLSAEGGFLFRIGFQIHLLGHEVRKK
ncbi:MAG: outer membrane beta-barrel protein [Sphingobacteriales bacterium]